MTRSATANATMSDARGGEALANLRQRLDEKAPALQPVPITPAPQPAPVSEPAPAAKAESSDAAERRRAKDRERKARKRQELAANREMAQEMAAHEAASQPTPAPQPEPEPALQIEPPRPGDDEEVERAPADLPQIEAPREGDDKVIEAAPVQESDFGPGARAGMEWPEVDDEGETPAEPTPQPEPAPVPQPPINADRAERERLALLEEVVAYLPEHAREGERRNLGMFDSRTLKGLREALREGYGDTPDLKERLAGLNAIYTARLADPAVKEARRLLDRAGHGFDKLASAAQRLLGSDVMINTLSAGEYRQQAGDAISNLGVLTRSVVDLEPALDYYKNYGAALTETSTTHALPAGMGHLLWILQHAKAHLLVAVSRDRAATDLVQDLQRRLTHREEQLAEAQKNHTEALDKLRAQTVTLPPENAPVYIYDTVGKRYLASPNPRTERLAVHSLYWTSNIEEALVFKTGEQQALGLLDKLMNLSVRRWPDREVQIAGVDVDTVKLARTALSLPAAK